VRVRTWGLTPCTWWYAPAAAMPFVSCGRHEIACMYHPVEVEFSCFFFVCCLRHGSASTVWHCVCCCCCGECQLRALVLRALAEGKKKRLGLIWMYIIYK